MQTLLHWLAIGQAVYYVLTGVWPLVHIESFMKVTGPKRDLWLVRTVGVVIIAVGLAIGVAAFQNQINTAIVTLAITSAIGLTAIDVIYVLNRTIDKIYLLDAVAEVVLIVAWVASITVH